MEKINLYKFNETSELLNFKFKQKKLKNSKFSIRAWAQQLGMSSHGPLQQILSGKRTLPKKYLPSIIRSLELSQSESLYLEAIIDFEKAKTIEEKKFYQNRLTFLRPEQNELQFLEIEHHLYMQDPIHSMILTLMERSDFKSDLKWIQLHLPTYCSLQSIEEKIQRLLQLNLAKKNGEELVPCQIHTSNKIDIPSIAVQEHHKKMSIIASELVSKRKIHESVFVSMLLSAYLGSLLVVLCPP